MSRDIPGWLPGVSGSSAFGGVMDNDLLLLHSSVRTLAVPVHELPSGEGAGQAAAEPGEAQFLPVQRWIVNRTTCGSWSLAWSANSALTCTTS